VRPVPGSVAGRLHPFTPLVLTGCVAIMAVAYGDQWTNMLQPFWALPVLAIAKLKMRDILGYTALTGLVAGTVMAVALWLVS